MKTSRNAIILGVVALFSIFSLARIYSDSGVIYKSRGRMKAPVPAVPVELIPAPTFKFINSKGEEITAESLRGKIYSLNLFFTSCPYTCPAITANLKTVQDEFASRDDVRIVSITVDPETDTVEKLNAFAEKNGIDLSRWNLLRGPIADVKTLVEQGLKMPLGEDANLHSNRAILVDKDGKIRGTFLALKPNEIEKMREAIRELVGEG